MGGLEAHAQSVTSVSALDLLEGAIKHLPATMDHEEEVAELLGGRHVVGREDHGPLSAGGDLQQSMGRYF